MKRHTHYRVTLEYIVGGAEGGERTRSVRFWSKQDWLDWERETGTVPDARCSGCGRGYYTPSREGVGCLACGSPVYSLPKEESDGR